MVLVGASRTDRIDILFIIEICSVRVSSLFIQGYYFLCSVNADEGVMMNLYLFADRNVVEIPGDVRKSSGSNRDPGAGEECQEAGLIQGKFFV